MMDINTWLHGVVIQVSANGQYQRVELYHGTADGQSERLDTIELRFSDGAVVDVEKLEAHIQDVAQQDADTHAQVGNGLVQRYALAAFHADAELPGTTHSFAVRGTEPPRSVSEVFAGSEPPSDRGERSQSMRMNDSLMRMVTTLWDGTHGLLIRQLTDCDRRREAAEARVLDTFMLQQAILDGQQDRLLAAARAEADLNRRADMWNLVKSFAPAIVSGLPGANKVAVVGKATVDFLTAMSPEEAGAIASVLPPERRKQLQDLLRMAAEEVERVANEAPDIKVEVATPPSAKKKGDK